MKGFRNQERDFVFECLLFISIHLYLLSVFLSHFIEFLEKQAYFLFKFSKRRVIHFLSRGPVL